MNALDLGAFADDPRILEAAPSAVHVADGKAWPTQGRWAAKFERADLGYSFGTLDDALRFLLGKPMAAKESAR
jgi:hypothetical protein